MRQRKGRCPQSVRYPIPRTVQQMTRQISIGEASYTELRILPSVAVHLDAAIGQEQDQPIPIFGDVFECRACWGLGRDLCAGMAQPCFEGFDLGCVFWFGAAPVDPRQMCRGLALSEQNRLRRAGRGISVAG
jgi:hypothetical protein